MMISLVRLSPLSGCVYCCWTPVSLSALWSFIPAPSVGSSYEDFGSGRVLPLVSGRCHAEDKSHQFGDEADWFVNLNSMILFLNCTYRL